MPAGAAGSSVGAGSAGAGTFVARLCRQAPHYALFNHSGSGSGGAGSATALSLSAASPAASPSPSGSPSSSPPPSGSPVPRSFRLVHHNWASHFCSPAQPSSSPPPTSVHSTSAMLSLLQGGGGSGSLSGSGESVQHHSRHSWLTPVLMCPYRSAFSSACDRSGHAAALCADVAAVGRQLALHQPHPAARGNRGSRSRSGRWSRFRGSIGPALPIVGAAGCRIEQRCTS